MDGLTKLGWTVYVYWPTLKFLPCKTASWQDEHDSVHGSMILIWINNEEIQKHHFRFLQWQFLIETWGSEIPKQYMRIRVTQETIINIILDIPRECLWSLRHKTHSHPLVPIVLYFLAPKQYNKVIFVKRKTIQQTTNCCNQSFKALIISLSL